MRKQTAVEEVEVLDTFDRNYFVDGREASIHHYGGYVSYSNTVGDHLRSVIPLEEYRERVTETYQEGTEHRMTYDIAHTPTGIREFPLMKTRTLEVTPPPKRMGKPIVEGDRVSVSGRVGVFTLITLTEEYVVLENGARRSVMPWHDMHASVTVSRA